MLTFIPKLDPSPTPKRPGWRRGAFGLLAAIVVFTQVGCGRFQPTKQSRKSSGALGSVSPSKLNNLTQIDRPLNSSSWVPENAFNLNPSTAQTKTFVGNLRIPYGWVYMAASAAIRFASPHICQVRSVETEADPTRAYASGEYPCGVLIDGGWKRLTTVNVPVQDIVKPSYRVHVDPFSVPLWISRKQYASSYQEDRLDSKGMEAIQGSTYFGDDISIRYTPHPDGKGADLLLCSSLPGMDISMPKTKINAKVTETRVFTITVGSKFIIDLGHAHFDSVRGCLKTTVQFAGESLAPTLSFNMDQYPIVYGSTFSGIHIEIENFLLQVLNNFASIFKLSVNRIANKQITQQFNKIQDQELETGAWFAKVHGQDALQSAADTLNRSIVRAMHTAGIPQSTDDIRNFLNRQCALIPVFQKVDADFAQLCTQALSAVKVSLQPFYEDPGLKAAGCYDHFANVHQSLDSSGHWKWWATQCGFSLRLQVQVDVASLDQATLTTVDQLVGSLNNLPEWLQTAAGQAGWSSGDQAALLLAIDQALKNGETIKTLSDLVHVLPNYLNVSQNQVQGWLKAAL